MRRALAPLVNRRHRFTATVGPSGYGGHGPTVCLRQIRCEATGKLLCEHCWCDIRGFYVLDGAKIGQRIALRATVRPYHRGDGSQDYHLAALRHVRRIKVADTAMAAD